LRRSGRLIVISVVPSALFSTWTFCMLIPFQQSVQQTERDRGQPDPKPRCSRAQYAI
jgi:hypothetical protein